VSRQVCFSPFISNSTWKLKGILICFNRYMVGILEGFIVYSITHLIKINFLKCVFFKHFGIIWYKRSNKKKCVVLVTCPSIVFTPTLNSFFPILKTQNEEVPTLFCLLFKKNSDFQSLFPARHHDVHRRLTSLVRKIAKHMQCTRVRFLKWYNRVNSVLKNHLTATFAWFDYFLTFTVLAFIHDTM
jgi:hypothetical protein